MSRLRASAGFARSLRAASALLLLASTLLCSVVVEAHVALWHPSMYGFCDGGNGNNNTCINTSNPVNPCQDEPFAPGVGGRGWWMHGNKDQPPEDGVYFEFPSGGRIHTELACNKGQTSWNIGDAALDEKYSCWGPPPLHTADTFEGGPTDETKGCAIALAWESDVEKLQPEDMIIITTNRTCPFHMHTEFDIPDDLPPCPAGGCHAFWLWIHEAGDSGGYSYQMYLSPFKAMLTGTTQTDPLPKPRVAQKCVDAPDLCVKGPKNPHYWSMNDRNNAFNPNHDPPYYNVDYGMQEGAQTDLRYVADPAAESAWRDEWEPLGCWGDNGRMLNGTFLDTWQNSVDFCLATCAGLGFTYAGVQYGSQCGCGDYITGSESPASDCPMACANNAAQTCGGGGTQNLYRRKAVISSTSSASSAARPSSSSSSLKSSSYRPAAASASSAAAASSYSASLSSRASSSASASSSGTLRSSTASSASAKAATFPSPAQITACLSPAQAVLRLEASKAQAAITSSVTALVARSTDAAGSDYDADAARAEEQASSLWRHRRSQARSVGHDARRRLLRLDAEPARGP